ncbi:putative GNAT family N-acetyltransferase [Phlyctema vagabunda]|uniref:GNAT family N-acetyltransferase n=1 Tax=Phlyctema vagabunda TaxID=108571 RepID=A0ABR4PFE2_9HELO
MASPSEWYKDNFLISTAPALLQPDAINEAFDSDFIYWAKKTPVDQLKKLLANSLCFGLYELPTSSADIAGRAAGPKQIGLARLITDRVSFAYMTDVYVLPEYQGTGLGVWLLSKVSDELDSWPDLRRSMLITSGHGSFYEKKMGFKVFEQGENDLQVLMKRGRGSVLS